MKAQSGSSYSSTLSLVSGLDGGEWSVPRPGRFSPWKETRYPLYWRLDGRQGRSGRVRKISPPPSFDPRTFQPVASRYTGWAITVHFLPCNTFKYLTFMRNLMCVKATMTESKVCMKGFDNTQVHGHLWCSRRNVHKRNEHKNSHG